MAKLSVLRVVYQVNKKSAAVFFPPVKMYYITWIDFSAFFAMLIVSLLIGVYFAYFASQKQNTVDQYLMGGKAMGVFPISMSLIAR